MTPKRIRASKTAWLSLWLLCQAAVHQRKRSEQKKVILEDPWSHLWNLPYSRALQGMPGWIAKRCQVKDADSPGPQVAIRCRILRGRFDVGRCLKQIVSLFGTLIDCLIVWYCLCAFLVGSFWNLMISLFILFIFLRLDMFRCLAVL